MPVILEFITDDVQVVGCEKPNADILWDHMMEASWAVVMNGDFGEPRKYTGSRKFTLWAEADCRPDKAMERVALLGIPLAIDVLE